MKKGLTADEEGTEVMHRANLAATVAMRAGVPMASGSWKRAIEEGLAKRGGKPGGGKPKKKPGLFGGRKDDLREREMLIMRGGVCAEQS